MPAAERGDIDHADVVLVRHGETVYNQRNVLSGDPERSVPLSARGREQARALAPLLDGRRFASTWHTRFGRTAESLALMRPSGHPPPGVLADLDDIDVGAFEGRDRDEYRAWRRHHGIDEAPPGGEARLHVVERYARGLRRLADEASHPALVVTHDQPIRYLENALRDEDPIFGPVSGIPNATPFPYSADELRRGADRLAAYAAGAGRTAGPSA